MQHGYHPHGEAPSGDVGVLQEQVQRLYLENEALKGEVADLRARLSGQGGTPSPSPPVFGGPSQPQQQQQQPPQQPGFSKMQLMGMQVVEQIEDVDTGRVTCVHAGIDGLLYTYGTEGVKVWGKDRKIVKKIPPPSGWMCGDFVSTNSCFIITTDNSSKVQVYNRATLGFMRDFNFGLYTPNYLVVTETHAAVAPGGEVFVIDLDSMQLIKKLSMSGGVGTLALHGNHLISCTGGGLEVHDMTSWERLKQLPCIGAKSTVVDGDLLYVGCTSSINVYDLKTFKEVAKMEGHNGQVRALVKVGNTLFSAGSDQTVKMWDLTKYGLVNSVTLPAGASSIDFWNGQLVTNDLSKGCVSLWGY